MQTRQQCYLASEMLSYSIQHKVTFEYSTQGTSHNPPTEVKQANLHGFLPGFYWPDNVSPLSTLWQTG